MSFIKEIVNIILDTFKKSLNDMFKKLDLEDINTNLLLALGIEERYYY